jgi:N-acetylneuraminic acid mutarotase
VAADHPLSFTNRVEMMDRIKTLGQENERVLAENDAAVAEKNREIAEVEQLQGRLLEVQQIRADLIEQNEVKQEQIDQLVGELTVQGEDNSDLVEEVEQLKQELACTQDPVTREKEKISSELEEAQSAIDTLRESHSIEVEALQIENADIKADIEHLHAIIAAKEREYKQRHESDKKEIKQWYEKQLEIEKHAMEEQHLSDRQALEQQHALQLKAIKDQLESKVSELSAKDAVISRKSGTIQSLQVKLGQALGTASSKGNLSVFSPGVKLTFTENTNLPKAIVGFLGQSITVGRDVYVGVNIDKKVFKYSITEDSWGTLPLAPVSYARIGCLNKKVLIVGGRISSNQITADIHEFDEASQQWVKSTSIPPMPTARAAATIVSWSSPPALVVCGGSNQRSQPMTVVEVYHGRTSQWHAVTSLPFPRAHMTHTVIHNVLYLVGGYEEIGVSSYKKTVLSILIPKLLESSLQSSPAQWQTLSITDVSKYRPAAASLGGCLLVVGGVKDTSWPPKPESVVSSVHAYCPSTSSWVLVGQLPQPLYNCTTATLPTGELLVIGGATSSDSGRQTNTTSYKCSLSIPL